MIIVGIQKTSFVDYPDNFCTTIFTKGCQFRCPFCHNSNLIMNNNDNVYDEDYVLNEIDKRKKLIPYICITGGEPLLQHDIVEFIQKLNNIGVGVKLDTNGYNSIKLKEVISNCNIDYIAMDIKNTKDKYAITSGLDNIDISNIDKSIKLIMKSNINYEFRTTAVEGLHTIDDLIDISKWIHKAKKYTIQNYKFSNNILNPLLNMKPFKEEDLKSVVDEINNKKYVEKCILNI